MSGGSRRRLRAGNQLPLRALSQSRRVGADSRDIRHAAKNAWCTSSTENAMAELAAATSLSRFPSFALRAACARDCPPTRCVVHLQRGRFLRGRATMSAATSEAQKRRSGHIDRVRPIPCGSIFAHEITVFGQLRAFFGGRESQTGPARSDRAVFYGSTGTPTRIAVALWGPNQERERRR